MVSLICDLFKEQNDKLIDELTVIYNIMMINNPIKLI